MELIRNGATQQLLRLPLSKRQARAANQAVKIEPEEKTLSWIEQKKVQRLTSMGMFRKAANVVRGTASIAELTEEVLEN
jgi:hypothetical protein